MPLWQVTKRGRFSHLKGVWVWALHASGCVAKMQSLFFAQWIGMELHTWLAFVAAACLIAISPGSGAVLCMSHGLSYGVRKTSATILGLQLGLLLILLVAGAGVGSLLLASELAFNVVKVAGATIFNTIAPPVAAAAGAGRYHGDSGSGRHARLCRQCQRTAPTFAQRPCGPHAKPCVWRIADGGGGGPVFCAAWCAGRLIPLRNHF